MSWPGIPEFTPEEIKDTAKVYYRDEEAYKKMYSIRNKGEKNALTAFVSDLGIEAIDKSVSQEDFGSNPPPDVHYKIYIAPPRSDCHRENIFYTLPNPVDTNTLIIYKPAHRSVIDLIDTVIHEYTHSTQCMIKYTKMVSKYNYNNHPYEREAVKMGKRYAKKCKQHIMKLNK